MVYQRFGNKSENLPVFCCNSNAASSKRDFNWSRSSVNFSQCILRASVSHLNASNCFWSFSNRDFIRLREVLSRSWYSWRFLEVQVSTGLVLSIQNQKTTTYFNSCNSVCASFNGCDNFLFWYMISWTFLSLRSDCLRNSSIWSFIVLINCKLFVVISL